MSAAIDGVAFWAEERGVFQVELVQSPGVALLDCRTNGGELLGANDCGENTGKAGAPDLSGGRAAEQLDVSGLPIARRARKASLCDCVRPVLHDATEPHAQRRGLARDEV